MLFAPSIIPRSGDAPQSLLSCLNSDTSCLGLGVGRFMAYSRSLSDEAQRRTNAVIAQGYYSSDSRFRRDVYDNIEDGETVEPPQKKTRRRQYVMAWRTGDGDLERIKPTESFWYWYLYYVQNPLLVEDDRFVKKFRNRFRLAYTLYHELVEDCKCKDSQFFDSGCLATQPGVQPLMC